MSRIVKRLYRIAVSMMLVVGSIAYTPQQVLAITGDPGTVEIDKTRDDGTDGVFEITLTVEGIPVVTPTDIVLVMDTSGSMVGSRNTASKDAATSFVNEVIGWNQGHRVGVVSFGTNPVSEQGLTSNLSDLTSTINGVNAQTNTGTHLEGGIRLAKQMLDGSASNRDQVIIVMSDGEPTYGYDFDMEYNGPVETESSGVIFPRCEVDVTNANQLNDAKFSGGRFNFTYPDRVGTGSSIQFTKDFDYSGTCS